MSGLINILLLLLLGIIVYQDLKQRAISWFLLPALLCCFVLKGLEPGHVSFLSGSLLNLGFVLLQMILLTLYMSFRNRKLQNIINTYLGIGDILFFVVICAAFSPLNFIFFYILSMLVTLAGMLIYIAWSKNANREIPLAGGMAAAMILLLLGSFMLQDIDFHNDDLLLNMISL